MAEVSVIDSFGRVVIPKHIRHKLKSNTIEFIVDEDEESIKLVPVKPLSYWSGKAKGILKSYEKTHNEDW